MSTETPLEGTQPGLAPGGETESAEARAARLERELAETRKEAAKYRTTLREQERQRDEAARQAEEAQQRALAEQGQFKTLAEQHAAKLAALEPEAQAAREQATKYAAALKRAVEAQLASLPDAIKVLLAKMPPDEALEYLAEHGDALRTPAQPTTPPRGTPQPARPQTARPQEPAAPTQRDRPLAKF